MKWHDKSIPSQNVFGFSVLVYHLRDKHIWFRTTAANKILVRPVLRMNCKLADVKTIIYPRRYIRQTINIRIFTTLLASSILHKLRNFLSLQKLNAQMEYILRDCVDEELIRCHYQFEMLQTTVSIFCHSNGCDFNDTLKTLFSTKVEPSSCIFNHFFTADYNELTMMVVWLSKV